MTDEDTSKHLHNWVATQPHGIFSWPTDACGYEQHIKFVHHRNAMWSTGKFNGTFDQFVLAYADMLDKKQQQSE